MTNDSNPNVGTSENSGSGRHAKSEIAVNPEMRTTCLCAMPQYYELAGMSSEFRGWGGGASLEEVREGMADWMRNGDARAFEERALALFRWQAVHNPVYGEFVAALGMEPRDVLN